jgi:hypothetical protein
VHDDSYSFSQNTQWKAQVQSLSASSSQFYVRGTSLTLKTLNLRRSGRRISSDFASASRAVLKLYARETNNTLSGPPAGQGLVSSSMHCRAASAWLLERPGGRRLGAMLSCLIPPATQLTHTRCALGLALQTFDALNSLYLDFGTHYVNRLSLGATQNVQLETYAFVDATLAAEKVTLDEAANGLFYYSANGYSGFSNMSNSSTAAAAEKVVALVINTGAYSWFQTQQAPSTVRVPFTAGGAVDCVAWSAAINAQAAVAPTEYGIVPLAQVYLDEDLWSRWGLSPRELEALATIVDAYLSSCIGGQCYVPPPVCSPGFYGDGTTCANCYTAGNQCSVAQTCDNVSGACIGGLPPPPPSPVPATSPLPTPSPSPVLSPAPAPAGL